MESGPIPHQGPERFLPSLGLFSGSEQLESGYEAKNRVGNTCSG